MATASTGCGPSTIWIGGTSALAQTFFEEMECTSSRSFILAAPDPPEDSWGDDMSAKGSFYLPLDMTDESSINRFFSKLHTRHVAKSVRTIIFGMRASLITGSDEDNFDLADNIPYFMDLAAKFLVRLTGVLHVSSVAVMNHTLPQSMLNEDAELPLLGPLSPYDRMKRQTEIWISASCRLSRLKSVQLRISGIFSNELGHNCIQMSAIRLQSVVGCYMQTPLDMNTSRNVCHCIQLILDRMEEVGVDRPLRPVYYYTRPTIEAKPYGQNLVDYRRAHNIWYAINLWERAVRLFLGMAIYCFNLIARWDEDRFYVLENIAYLLKVSLVEHTFDNSRIRADFPEINGLEETIFEGFVRIKKRRHDRR